MSVRQFDAAFDIHGGLRDVLASCPDSQARIELLPGPCRRKAGMLLGRGVAVKVGRPGCMSMGWVRLHLDQTSNKRRE